MTAGKISTEETDADIEKCWMVCDVGIEEYDQQDSSRKPRTEICGEIRVHTLVAKHINLTHSLSLSISHTLKHKIMA